MPTNSFERIGPGSGVDRVGGPQDVGNISPDTTVRHDDTLHMPLSLHISGPGVLPPAPPPAPTPPAPSELELRAQLALAIETKHERENEFARAEAAHERAERHLARCRQRAAEYAGLSEVITRNTVEALRCSAGMLDPLIDEETELALNDRTKSQEELAAAQSAVSTFLHERAQAAQALGDASRQVDVAVARILAFPAEQLAREYEALQERAKVICAALVTFDSMIATPNKVAVPASVRIVYNGIDENQFVRLLASPLSALWRDAAAALRNDPTAQVELALPDAPPSPPPLPRPRFGPPVHAVPIRRDEPEEAA
jgi:hypothetical protein